MYYLNVIETPKGRTVAGIFRSEEDRKQYAEMTICDSAKVIGKIVIDVDNLTVEFTHGD